MNRSIIVKSAMGVVAVSLLATAVYLIAKGSRTPDDYKADLSGGGSVKETVSNKKSTETTGSEENTEITPYDLTEEQKIRAERLISLFENGTIEISYGYIENLGDGRGYTAGRAGFTTADGDVYQVVQEYTKLKETNKLAKYLPTLKRLAEKGSDSVKDLKDFDKAWTESANDEAFQQAQNLVVGKLYYLPSKKYSDTLDLKLAISRAFLYDTIIQHGDGDDKDGISALLDKTADKMGGTPAKGIDEVKWLGALIQIRREDLKNPADKETKDEWSQSTGRCDVFEKILEDKNYDLKGPIKISTSEYKVTVP